MAGCQRCSSDTPQSNSALSEVEYLLNTPNVRIDTHAVLNGRRAIELTFDRGRFSYWISRNTYQPLQVVDRFFPGVTRYPVARVLSGAAASPGLLSLEAQHRSAGVDHSPIAYNAANQRVRARAAQTGR